MLCCLHWSSKSKQSSVCRHPGLACTCALGIKEAEEYSLLSCKKSNLGAKIAPTVLTLCKVFFVAGINHCLFLSKKQVPEKLFWIWMYVRWLAHSLLLSCLVLFTSGSVVFYLLNSSYLFLHTLKIIRLLQEMFVLVGLKNVWFIWDT